MSHPGHIRHFDPNAKNYITLETQEHPEDQINSSQILRIKSNYGMLLFNKLKSNLLSKTNKRVKQERKWVKEENMLSKDELKVKYLAIIRKQKAKGVFEWIMVPITWLEWKLINKPWIVKRLIGLLILVIGLYAFGLLNNFVGYGSKTFFGMIRVAIGVILNMILTFVVFIGLGLTFFKIK